MKRRGFFGAAVGSLLGGFRTARTDARVRNVKIADAVIGDIDRLGYVPVIESDSSLRDAWLDKARMDAIFKAFVEQDCLDANPRYVGTINPKTVADRNMLMSFYGPLR